MKLRYCLANCITDFKQYVTIRVNIAQISNMLDTFSVPAEMQNQKLEKQFQEDISRKLIMVNLVENMVTVRDGKRFFRSGCKASSIASSLLLPLCRVDSKRTKNIT